jgi:hypothetical protein
VDDCRDTGSDHFHVDHGLYFGALNGIRAVAYLSNWLTHSPAVSGRLVKK